MSDELQRAILHRFRAVRPWAGLREDWPGYLILPGQNLLPSLADETVLADFRDGVELVGDPPRFAAVHSTAALTANVFGPFQGHPERLRLAGLGGFSSARFQRTLATGPGTGGQAVDFIATGAEGSVAVDSSFTEVLGRKSATFAEDHADAVDRVAEAPWRAMYESLRADPGRFEHLDAARLVKQYLGMRHSLADRPGALVLLHLFWEPASDPAPASFRRHRDEVVAFADDVAGSAVRFDALSYDELWTEWSRSSSWDGMHAHVASLRARYAVRVGPVTGTTASD